MTFRGERFVVDLSDDEDDPPNATPPVFDLIGEVKERAPSTLNSSKAPTPPKSSSTSTGFPEHKKRTRPSAFKQQRAAKDAKDATPTPTPTPNKSTTKTEAEKFSIAQEEKRLINEENKRRLASMSPEELENERAELMSAMPSSLLERFLRRANIDGSETSQETSQGADTSLSAEDTPGQPPEESDKSTKPQKSVSFDVPPPEPPQPSKPSPPQTQPQTLPPSNDDLPPPHPPPDLQPASEPPRGPIHFPTPPPTRQSPMPNLDPSSPSFLTDLQTHYFPNTPHDPSTLSWFQQPSTSEPTDPSEDPENPLPPQQKTSPYTPNSSSTSLPPSSLRFTLTGSLLSPKTALSLPTTLGLHHHGSDPQAAGYTIPELAILSRSTYPAQRCIAWQVLGRLMFRLGRGEFGSKGSALVDGLWDVVEGEKVVGGMLREAGDGGGGGGGADTTAAGSVGRHASAKAWAVEGLWLWRLGGGGDRGLVKEGTVRSS
ncbi:hypothetical protein FQN54_004312 [Arachnomyces sp. PD_36]|nr:hypothetical protein FQN54_004312 [Arachnomyces sp. PD_36]